LNDEGQAVDRQVYNTSKLIDVYIAREISKLPAASKIIVNSCNPGLCVSDLRRGFPWLLAAVFNKIAWSTSFGAQNLTHAAVADVSSGSYITECHEGESYSPLAATDSEEGVKIQAKLWKELCDVWVDLAPEVKSILGA